MRSDKLSARNGSAHRKLSCEQRGANDLREFARLTTASAA
jgi:hypothetical protein